MKKIFFTLYLIFGLISISLAQNSTKEITVEKENSLVIIKKLDNTFQKNDEQNLNPKKVKTITLQKEYSPVIIKTNIEVENSSHKKIISRKKTAIISKNKKIIKN